MQRRTDDTNTETETTTSDTPATILHDAWVCKYNTTE